MPRRSIGPARLVLPSRTIAALAAAARARQALGACGCACASCRTLGDLSTDATAGASIVGDFDPDVQQYAQEGLSDYQTAKAAVDAASATYNALTSDDPQKAWDEQRAIIEAYATIIATAAGAAPVAAIFDAWLSGQPGAAQGPGLCTTDPPASDAPPDLRAWAHYHSPASDPYCKLFNWPDNDPPGSFEAIANALLFYNAELYCNCFGNSKAWQLPQTLLGSLIAAWNTVHGPPTRVIKRANLHYADNLGQAMPLGFDPIAMALQNTTDGHVAQFTINDGPEKVVVKPLTFHLGPADAAPAAAAAPRPAASSSSSSGGAVVAVAGAAGLAWWLFKMGGLAKVKALL